MKSFFSFFFLCFFLSLSLFYSNYTCINITYTLIQYSTSSRYLKNKTNQNKISTYLKLKSKIENSEKLLVELIKKFGPSVVFFYMCLCVCVFVSNRNCNRYCKRYTNIMMPIKSILFGRVYYSSFIFLTFNVCSVLEEKDTSYFFLKKKCSFLFCFSNILRFRITSVSFIFYKLVNTIINT